MKLVRSIVSKIGFAERKQTDFNGGINFIFGKNNSGKTLISKSYIDTLYPTKPSLIEDDGWDTMFATFTIELGNAIVDIQRKGNKEIKVFEVTHNGATAREEVFSLPIDGSNFSINHLNTLHIIFDKEAFSTLCYIPSPFDVQYYNRDFSVAMRKILLLDSSLYYCAFSKLFAGKQHDTDNYQENVITEIKNKIKHCKTKLDLLELKEQKQKKHRAEIEEINERIKTYNNEIKSLEKKIESCNRYMDTLSAIQNVTQQLEVINERIKNLKEKIGMIEKYTRLIASKYPQFKDFTPEKRNNIHAMQNIYRQIQSISEEIETIIFNQESKNHTLARNLLIINIVLALGVLFVFLKPVVVLSSVYRWLMISFLILFQLSSIGYYLIYTIMHSFKKIVMPLQQQKETYQIKLETLLNQNDIVLDGITVDEIYEFLLQYFEEYNEYNEKQIDLLTIQKEVDDYTPMEQLEEEKKTLEDNITLLHNQLHLFEEEIGVAIESADHVQMVKTNLQNELNEKKALIVSLQAKLNDIPEEEVAFDDEKSVILQEIADLEKELNTINEKNRLVNIIINSFNTAMEKYYNDKFNVLTEKIKIMTQDITKNKFGKIDEEFIQKIITNMVEASNASLKYCVYITAIFALYELLQQELPHVHLPLIIDDPFVLMDEDAMAEFIVMLQQWASNRQVIVFTHNSNIKKMCAVSEL